ncbi:MAG: helicase, partial [Altererythrobacter sp.]|nr:helicase [Altererythrobacter sp.]
GELIGRLDGFRFAVAPDATVADRKMLLAAGEKALPALLAQRAQWLVSEGIGELKIGKGAILWGEHKLATIELNDDFGTARIAFVRELSALPEASRLGFEAALQNWLDTKLEPLEPLRKLATAAQDPAAGSGARALLHTVIAGHGVVTREDAGLQHLPKEMRPYLRKLGVVFGALDIFAHALLKPAPRQLLHALGVDKRPLNDAMLPVLKDVKQTPAGYRPAGSQMIRVDLAEKILRAAFDARAKATPNDGKPPQRFFFDTALPISVGLEADNVPRMLGGAGFKRFDAPKLAEGAFGPATPDNWGWRPRRPGGNANRRREQQSRGRSSKQGKHAKGNAQSRGPKPQRKAAYEPAKTSGAFDALKDLLG